MGEGADGGVVGMEKAEGALGVGNHRLVFHADGVEHGANGGDLAMEVTAVVCFWLGGEAVFSGGEGGVDLVVGKAGEGGEPSVDEGESWVEGDGGGGEGIEPFADGCEDAAKVERGIGGEDELGDAVDVMGSGGVVERFEEEFVLFVPVASEVMEEVYLGGRGVLREPLAE